MTFCNFFFFFVSAVKGTVATREDLEGFVSFLVVLKDHYKDNLEIPRTVIQLLHIYQPEQGLDEYLRVCIHDDNNNDDQRSIVFFC